LLIRGFSLGVTEFGDDVMLDGWPHIRNHGRLRIGQRAHIQSRPVPVELVVEQPGAEIIIGADSVLHPGVTVSAHALIDIGERVQIGRYTMILDTSFHDLYEREKTPPPRAIYIEDGARIGANSCILPGVRIGAGAVVIGGSVVNRDVAPGVTVVGVPAKPLVSDAPHG
jgi:acetyltransferase-like isoleucine patch superfamily enzyme